MQPLETVATAKVDGSAFTLARRGEEWQVLVDGRMLMSSRQHGSEESLATEALAMRAAPRDVLVGGLGLGFTLRAVLDRVGAETQVLVAELVPDLVEWNRARFPELHRHALDDPRVAVHVGDVRDLLRRSAARFDAILLDVDNGPVGMSKEGNGQLYTERGVRECHDALRPGGVLAVWSAGPSARYERFLARGGFSARALRVAARPGSTSRHVVFVGARR